MLEKSLISGFADEIDSAFDVQLGVLESLGQKYIELRAADGIGIADFTMDKAKEIKEKMDACGIAVSQLAPLSEKSVLMMNLSRILKNTSI